MTDGTTLATFKAWFATALAARAGMTGVQVAYARPTQDLQVEAVWLGNATGVAEPSGGDGTADETYNVEAVVQVLATSGRDEAAADQRTVAILGEIRTMLRGTLPTGVGNARLAAWDQQCGPLGENASPKGSRFDITIQVMARA